MRTHGRRNHGKTAHGRRKSRHTPQAIRIEPRISRWPSGKSLKLSTEASRQLHYMLLKSCIIRPTTAPCRSTIALCVSIIALPARKLQHSAQQLHYAAQQLHYAAQQLHHASRQLLRVPTVALRVSIISVQNFDIYALSALTKYLLQLPVTHYIKYYISADKDILYFYLFIKNTSYIFVTSFTI